jgi:transcriptional regulator with XRE-family HTH domain
MKEMSEESIEFVVGRLEKMLRGRQMSQTELAEQSEVTQPTISRIFSRSQKPSVDALKKLCAAFGLTLSGVMEEIDPESRHMIGYLATPLTAVVQNPSAEAELKRLVGQIRRIASDAAFSAPAFEIYWPGDYTHPTRNPDFKPSLVYLKDRSTASTYDFLVILCAEPSYGVGQENEIATQAGVPAVRLVPANLSRMMTGSFISARDVQFEGTLSAGITFDEEQFSEALHWVRKMRFKHRALQARLNGKGFGTRLRQLFSDRSGDYQRFADELGIGLPYLHALMDESIAVSNPSVRLLQRMSSLLQVSVGHLVGEGEEDAPIWLESNASWNSWMLDGTPKDGGIALALRNEWRANYKASRLEESIASSRKTVKPMKTRDWEKLYRERSGNGKPSGNKSLFDNPAV